MTSMPGQTPVTLGQQWWSRGPALFVWGVWAGMVAIAIWHFVYFTRNMPWAEDWLLIAAMTGHEADLGSWLWTQNNEHRLPLPRLAMLALLKVTGGNFRLLHRLMTQIARLVEINALQTVTSEVVDAARESLVIGIA